MDKYIIYQHVNKINGKRYIGQTSQEPNKRWRDGKGYSDSPKFWEAIQKYGWDNFEHIIIEEGNSQDWANEREIYWIAYYDTFNNDDKGYNMTPGGSNYLKELWAIPEYREKMCQAFSIARQKSWSDEDFAKKRLEALVNGLRSAWSDPKWRAKRIANLIGDKNPNAKAVINIDSGRIFSTIKEASEWANIGQSGIGECCNGKRRTSGIHPDFGYRLHWQYLNNDNITIEEIEKDRGKHRNRKAVKCLNTGHIFNNLDEAATWSGLKTGTSISRCCRGINKTAGIHPITKEPCKWVFVERGEKI